VLEHPAHSNAWATFNLRAPMRKLAPHKPGWTPGAPWPEMQLAGMHEWTCEVWQSAYGHAARKKTWLLYVGGAPPPELNWTRKAGAAQIGWFDRIKPTLSKREATATPVAFRDMLLDLARASQPTQNARAAH
jgi:hypothetical protein